MPRKFRIGRLPKNYARKNLKKQVGRPRRRGTSTSTHQCTSEQELSHEGSSMTESKVHDVDSDVSSPHHMNYSQCPRCPNDDDKGEAISLSPSHSLASSLQLPSQQWIIQQQSKDCTAVCKISAQPGSSSQALVITHCIMIESDLSWTVSVHCNQIDKDKCSVFSGSPKKLSSSSLQALVSLLDKCNVCPGNPDKHFIEMALSKKGKFFAKDGSTVVARVDDYSKVCLNGEMYDQTIRGTSCEVLARGNKCASCVAYRGTLRKMYHRWLKHKRLSPSRRQSTTSRINVRWLSSPDKRKRYTKLRARLDSTAKENKRLRETIKSLTRSGGVELQSDLHSDFVTIMNEMTEKVHKDNPQGSFRRLFWDQQIEALNTKNRRQIIWHPAMIKWCLHLKFLSSGAYHALRTSGLINLPSERTLRDYTHWIRSGVGFQDEIDAQLVKEAAVSEEKDKYVVLMWDEMKIKEDLVFDKHTSVDWIHRCWRYK